MDWYGEILDGEDIIGPKSEMCLREKAWRYGVHCALNMPRTRFGTELADDIVWSE
jgi:hypothetical protein